MRLHSIHHCLTWHYIPCIHTFNHIYALDMTHILCTMDQEPPQQALIHTGNLDSMYTMDLMSVMPQCIQLSWNALQHQTPLQLPFPIPNSSSFPLPSIPSSAQIEPHIWTPSSHNNQNNQNHYFYNANSHNNQNCPFYDTWELPFSTTYVNHPSDPPVHLCKRSLQAWQEWVLFCNGNSAYRILLI